MDTQILSFSSQRFLSNAGRQIASCSSHFRFLRFLGNVDPQILSYSSHIRFLCNADRQIASCSSETCGTSSPKTHQARQLSLEFENDWRVEEMDENGWKIEKYWKCASCPSMALLVMLLLFLACWAPIHILNIIEDFGVPVCCSCCSKGVLVHLRLLTFITITMIRCTVGLTTTSPFSWLISSQWPPRARIQFSMAGSMGRFPKRNFRTFFETEVLWKGFCQ